MSESVSEEAISEDKTFDPIKTANGLIEKHGSAAEAVAVLLGEAKKLRDKNKELKSLLPKDNQTIADADDLKILAKYRELGDPKSLSDLMGSYKELSAQVENFTTEKHASRAAKILGYESEVLTELARDKKIKFEFKQVPGPDGKSVEQPFVKGEGEAEPIPLADFVSSRLQPFLPALKPERRREPTAPSRAGLSEPEPRIEPEKRGRSLFR